MAENVEYLSEWPPPESKETSQSDVDAPDVKKMKKDLAKIAKKTPCQDLKDAKTALAAWFRKNKSQIEPHLDAVPKSSKSLLNAIRKTRIAKDFLKDRLEQYLEQYHCDDPDHWRVLASYYSELGDHIEALKCIQQACNLLKLGDLTESSDSSYLDTISQLDEISLEILSQKEKLLLNLNSIRVKSDDAEKSFGWSHGFSIQRIDAKVLSVGEFRNQFVEKGIPVVVTGLLDEVNPDNHPWWDFNFIGDVAGTRIVTLKRREALSSEWARLDPAVEMTVKGFIDKLAAGDKSVQSLYLFDWSLPLFCPELNSKISIPKYFGHDLLKKTSTDALYHQSWPSLFVAPKGVISDLHVDAFASNFWMLLFKGNKKWTFFHRDVLPCLRPRYDDGFDPVFDFDVQNKAHLGSIPENCMVDVILNPGEMLFVPHGSPHFVENLEESIAISGNFVDSSNVVEVKKHLRRNALMDPRAKDLLMELKCLTK